MLLSAVQNLWFLHHLLFWKYQRLGYKLITGRPPAQWRHMGKVQQSTIKGPCVHAHVNISEIYNPEIRIQEQERVYRWQPARGGGLYRPTLKKNYQLKISSWSKMVIS